MKEELDINEGAREALKIAEEAELGYKQIQGKAAVLIPVIAAAWSLFQLSLASILILDSILIRSIHLTFAITLVYLSHPMFKKQKKGRLGRYLSARDRITLLDYALAAVAALAALYIVIDYAGISMRPGALITRDVVIGIILVTCVLEAARRSLGPVLPIVALVFILYSFFGPYMPGVIAFKGVSLSRFINQITSVPRGYMEYLWMYLPPSFFCSFFSEPCSTRPEPDGISSSWLSVCSVVSREGRRKRRSLQAD